MQVAQLEVMQAQQRSPQQAWNCCSLDHTVKRCGHEAWRVILQLQPNLKLDSFIAQLIAEPPDSH